MIRIFFNYIVHLSLTHTFFVFFLVSIPPIIPPTRSTPTSIASTTSWARRSLVSIFSVRTISTKMPSFPTLITSHTRIKTPSASSSSSGSRHCYTNSSSAYIYSVSSPTCFILGSKPLLLLPLVLGLAIVTRTLLPHISIPSAALHASYASSLCLVLHLLFTGTKKMHMKHVG